MTCLDLKRADGTGEFCPPIVKFCPQPCIVASCKCEVLWNLLPPIAWPWLRRFEWRLHHSPVAYGPRVVLLSCESQPGRVFETCKQSFDWQPGGVFATVQ